MNQVEIVERNGGRVIVAPGVITRGTIVADGSFVEIGKGVVMNRPVLIRAAEGASLRIGAGCLLSDVTIYTSDLHSVIDDATGERVNPAEPVVIGERVWLADGVLVLPGSRIGSDSVIGARSVVSGQIPAGVVAVGVPARVVRTGVRWAREKL